MVVVGNDPSIDELIINGVANSNQFVPDIGN